MSNQKNSVQLSWFKLDFVSVFVLILITLKLTGTLDIPWWMVLLPFGIAIISALTLIAIALLVLTTKSFIIDRKNKKKIDEAFIHYQKEQEAYQLERKKQNSDQFCLALKRLAENNRKKYGR